MYKVEIYIVLLTIFVITDARKLSSIFACNHEIVIFYPRHDFKTFCDAQSACASWKPGATLVMPKTKCLNDALGALVEDAIEFKRMGPKVWIGGTLLHGMRHWTWMDGSFINDRYTSWLADEPSKNTADQCMETKKSYFWNVKTCSHVQAYACQIDVSKASPERHYSFSDYASDPNERVLSFKDAEKVCADINSKLIVLKNKRVFSTFQKKIGKHTYDKYWIGAYFNDGDWMWNDGEVVNYTNWMTGKPSSNTSNKCIAMKYEGWEDFDCDKSKFHFVCESTAPHTVKISDERPIALIGENLIINCSASGVPIPDVRWYNNGTEVSEKNDTFERIYQTFENGISTLFIQNTSLADTGQYRCKANNTIKKGRRSAFGFALLKVVDQIDTQMIKSWKLEEDDKEHKNEEKKRHLCRPAIPKLTPPEVIVIHRDVTPAWAIPVVVVLSIAAFILILAIVILTRKR